MFFFLFFFLQSSSPPLTLGLKVSIVSETHVRVDGWGQGIGELSQATTEIQTIKRQLPASAALDSTALLTAADELASQMARFLFTHLALLMPCHASPCAQGLWKITALKS